jgi:hypothetical protein
MVMTTSEVAHRTFEAGNTGELHSPFLTDRESAQVTALATLGPLALLAFDTEPELGIRPTNPEATESNTHETPGIPEEEFTRTELLTIMRQQHTVAAAAIMFADSRLS